MHSYLQAIGLGKYVTKNQIKNLINEIADDKKIIDRYVDGDITHVEISLKLGKHVGITYYGTEDSSGNFEMDYYFPYALEFQEFEIYEVSMEKQIDSEMYKAVSEDVRLGVSVIFHVNNSFEYRKRLYEEKDEKINIEIDELIGLSCDGKILFPVSKTQQEIMQTMVASDNRNKLLHAARQGDEEAMESLTMEDLDTYNMINKRIQTEDVFSIVDSSFMPYGIQCDRYTIVGNIIEVIETVNDLTKEELYLLYVECRDLVISVVINKSDLLGEPAPGRRFKGVIWLQGKLTYNK